MTAIVWWTSFSSLVTFFVIRCIIRRLFCASTAYACPVLVLLLYGTVGCVSRDLLFLVFVLRIGALDLAYGAGLGSAAPIAVSVVMVLVTAGSAGFVRDLVLRAGAVGLTVSLAVAFRFLRFLIAFADDIGVIVEWCVGGRCTLGTAYVHNLGTFCISSVIDLVLRRSLLLVAGCTFGAAVMCVALGWSDARTIASSVIRMSCCISQHRDR